MDCVILDLEWDSMYFPKEKRFINHILQIGAVRLNSEFSVVDTFETVVRSDISKRVSSRFAKLTGITSEEMRAGVDFKQAVEAYNNFSNGAEVTMTWSNSDLYTIIENEDKLLENTKFKFNKYLDLQKLVQSDLKLKGYESNNQIALEAAAEFLGVSTEKYEMHTALDDCKVCAELLKLCFNQKRFNSLLKDATKPDFYARLRFKPYSISDINDKDIQKKELEFVCPQCASKAERIGRFKYRNRWFVADFECKKCHFKFNGRVTFKKTYDDLQIKHKVCEYKPKKRKKDDMHSVPETVQSSSH